MDEFKLKFPEFPVLHTRRLLMREITLDDSADIFAIFSNPEVTLYYDVPTMKEMQEAEELVRWWQERIKTGKALRWGFCRVGDPHLIGTGGFSELYPENYCAEIGSDLAQSYWNQGITTEAMAEVLRFGFEQMGLNRIETWIMVENIASIKMVQKIGLIKEGLMRRRQYWRGEFRDVELFAILREEWESRTDEERKAG